MPRRVMAHRQRNHAGIQQLDLAKRWRDRRQRWVAPGELFTPSGYVVDVVPERVAKPWICAHHYAGTFPAARLSCGLFASTGSDSRLVGVAVFSVPMNQSVIPSYSGFAPDAGVELGRFVCAPEVRYNGESWFLARAFAQLRREKPRVRAVLSFADPLERRDEGGFVVKPAHWGVIYQASNAIYVGRSSCRTLLIGPNGRVVSGRAVSKIRLGERGSQYAERLIVTAGAPARAFGESPAAWFDRLQHTRLLRRVRHGGNLAYLFGLDEPTRALLRFRHRGGLPHPRRDV